LSRGNGYSRKQTYASQSRLYAGPHQELPAHQNTLSFDAQNYIRIGSAGKWTTFVAVLTFRETYRVPLIAGSTVGLSNQPP
jgi:hypothetical protein